MSELSATSRRRKYCVVCSGSTHSKNGLCRDCWYLLRRLEVKELEEFWKYSLDRQKEMMAKWKLSRKPGEKKKRSGGLSSDPEKRAKQLANLYHRSTSALDSHLPMAVQKIANEMTIIEFAEAHLGVDFSRRPAQEVVLRCMYGMPLSSETDEKIIKAYSGIKRYGHLKSQMDIYREITGNQVEFEAGIEKVEGIWVVGARGGKSFMTSIIALYEATRVKWKKYLSDGETGYAAITATRQKQAEDIIQKACVRMLEGSKLKSMIVDAISCTLRLSNGMTISSFPCNSTAARGLPIFMLIFDEIAFYRLEGPKADEQIFSALRPRMAQFPGAKCILISTPASEQGLFWDYFNEGKRVSGRLTIEADTQLMNPTIESAFIEKEYRRDVDNARREFGAKFAKQVSSFFPTDKVENCLVLAGDLPYDVKYQYAAGIDQSGLSGRDRFAFAIAHGVPGIAGEVNLSSRKVVDVLRSWDTTDGDEILHDIGSLTGMYGIRHVMIDRYASGWVRASLEKLGLEVEISPSMTDIYTNMKSLMIAGKLELPDHSGLKQGLFRTAGYFSKANNLTIAHERSSQGHGDEADAVGRAIYATSQLIEFSTDDSPDADEKDRTENEYTTNIAFAR
jgi:hypothetical protein